MNQVASSYAHCLIPLLEGIKSTGDSNLIWTARRVIRRWTEFPEQLDKPNQYSEGAMLVAQSRGIAPEQLRRATYLDQTKKSGLQDPNHSKGAFHHEHIVPISRLVDGLIQLESPTAQQVHNYIQQEASIAWILKEEQKRLDKVCKVGERTPELLESLGIRLLGETKW